MTSANRPVIVLLGMHRSGTSLTMSVLEALGVSCGDNLIRAGRGNEVGFFEHRGIVTAHERLLGELDRVWHGPKGSYPLPELWLESDAARRAKRDLAAIVEGEVAAANGRVWGFKDPRTCRLLPLWKQIFEMSRTEPRYLIVVRDPAAVCASLKKHNGMDRARSELTWLQYNLEPLHHCGDNLLLVADYDRLVDQTQYEVERFAKLLRPLVAIGPDGIKDAITRISVNMRRSAEGGFPIDNSVVERAYEGLSAMAGDKRPDQNFSCLLSSFPDLQRLFQPWRHDRQHTLFDWTTRMIIRGRYR